MIKWLFDCIVGQCWCLLLFIKTAIQFSLHALFKGKKIAPKVETYSEDQTGRVAIVTGGSLGIGYAVAKKLASLNMHVIIASSSMTNLEKAVMSLREAYPKAVVESRQLDLASFASVKEFADWFLGRNLPLHVLINNAGIILAPYRITEDGYQVTMQVNFLSHALLTHLLFPKLCQSSKPGRCARIVNVSSSAQADAVGSISQTFRQVPKFWYSSINGYCLSKLAMIFWARHLLHQKLLSQQVTMNALNPGFILTTNVVQRVHPVINYILLDNTLRRFSITAEEAARNVLYLALSATLEAKSGEYFDGNVLEPPNGKVEDVAEMRKFAKGFEAFLSQTK